MRDASSSNWPTLPPIRAAATKRPQSRVSRSASVAKPINYMRKRWDRFTRFLDDGRICLTNNAAERVRFADLHWDASRGSLPAQSAVPTGRRPWPH
jgi:Transposase IS66 family